MKNLVPCAALAFACLAPPPQAWASVLAHPSRRQLDEVAALVEKHYIRAIGRDSLSAAARRCFEGTLDRYTVYLDSTAAVELERQLAGRFGGIGAGVTSDSTTGVFRISSLQVDSPALRAGLQTGDTLVAVDGAVTRGHDFFDVIALIRGPVGSLVRLTIRRPASPNELHVTIRRAAVELPTVRALRIGGSEAQRYLVDERSGVGYVRIESFSKRTPAELDLALAAVQRVHARALVLDLRDNGGGLVRSAVAAADRFLDSGTILTQRVRGKPDQVARARGGNETHLPLAVLVNAHTASAAEILAASLQDNRRAIVVGSRSFGKGVSLEIYHLKRSPGLLKLTTAVALRPSGGSLERHIPQIGSERGGVWPDSSFAVTLPEEEERRWSDLTFQTTLRMQAVGAAQDSTPPPRDLVLERAVEALSAAAAR